jgi:hypothetical protein
MSEVKPLSPEEAQANKITLIPNEVVAAVNILLAARFDSSINIKCSEIIELAQQLFVKNGSDAPSYNHFYEKKWLDIEPMFRKAGWKVTFDKPGYNESYESNFTFKPGDK